MTAVAIRKNTLIFIVAYILIWMVVYIDKRKSKCLFIIFVLIAAAAAGILLPPKFYEYRAKNIMGKGVPTIAYIAMGLQWSENRAPGSWNGYHSDLFMECSFDVDLTSQISAENAKNSLRYMIKNPNYMFRFFYYKQIGQWAKEEFGCFYETLDFYGDRTSAAWDVYQGRTKERFLSIMSVHQSLVYLGAGGFCVLGVVRWMHRKQKGRYYDNISEHSIEKMLFLVVFIGGFLFSMMWEAGPRYNLPYFVMLIPCAADWIANISCCMEAFLKNRLNNHAF